MKGPMKEFTSSCCSTFSCFCHGSSRLGPKSVTTGDSIRWTAFISTTKRAGMCGARGPTRDSRQLTVVLQTWVIRYTANGNEPDHPQRGTNQRRPWEESGGRTTKQTASTWQNKQERRPTRRGGTGQTGILTPF